MFRQAEKCTFLFDSFKYSKVFLTISLYPDTSENRKSRQSKHLDSDNYLGLT